MRPISRVLVLILCFASLAHADDFTFDHENILGTFLHLQITADSVAAAHEIEQIALQEIDRLNTVFSTYDSQSELSRFLAQPVGARVAVSPDMAALMRSSTHWQVATHSAYHPGAESLYKIWKAAAEQNKLPDADELKAKLGELQSPAWSLDELGQTAERTCTYAFSFNAIAEGYIVDRVIARVREKHNPPAFLVNLGGEVYGFGQTFSVGVRNPRAADESQAELTSLPIRELGMSTSGGYRRGWTIEGKHYSHVLDPRSGQPVDHALSTTVVAQTTLEADVLATALHVLPIDEAQKLADSLDVAWLSFDAKNHVTANEKWIKMFGEPPAPTELASTDSPQWNPNKVLSVAFHSGPAAARGRFRRPYIAVWVEDKAGYPVRTISLWVEKSPAGRGWISELRRWYKSDSLRRTKGDPNPVTTMSEATRAPGDYEVTWNGKNNAGEYVAPGDYVLFVESAREHGTYQLIRQAITIGDEPFKYEPADKLELSGIVIDYRDR